jgi:hypothetical protein
VQGDKTAIAFFREKSDNKGWLWIPAANFVVFSKSAAFQRRNRLNSPFDARQMATGREVQMKSY